MSLRRKLISMKGIPFWLIIMFFSLMSCTKDGVSPVVFQKVPIAITEVTMPATIKLNEELLVEIKAEANNGCYSFAHISSIERSGYTEIKAIADLPNQHQLICPDVMLYVNTVFKKTFTERGIYTFKFLRYGNQYITRTVTVQ